MPAINLYDLKLNELTDLIVGWGQSAYRAKQVWQWLYQQKVQSFEEMGNIPQNLRDKLTEETTLSTLTIATERLTAPDGFDFGQRHAPSRIGASA